MEDTVSALPDVAPLPPQAEPTYLSPGLQRQASAQKGSSRKRNRSPNSAEVEGGHRKRRGPSAAAAVSDPFAQQRVSAHQSLATQERGG